MLEDPFLGIYVTKAAVRKESSRASQNSLKIRAVLMTVNHQRSAHPLPPLKSLCLLRKKRRATGGIPYICFHFSIYKALSCVAPNVSRAPPNPQGGRPAFTEESSG